MRILYIDIASLRPDHLGCYGYDRNTSPHIDRLATEGKRFTNYYASDAPCLPSRTALFTSRFGIHTGVINHGGINASMRPRGANRVFNTQIDEYRTWMTALRDAGLYTALISIFPQHHGAMQVLDGFDEWQHTNSFRSDHVYPDVEDWLQSHAQKDDWYLHVNFWDPHTPYDTPSEYGTTFDDATAPDWPDESTIQDHYASYGPHSAQEPHGWHGDSSFEQMPDTIASRADFEQWIDGYDTGIHFVDDHVGRILDQLATAGVLDDTLIIVSADHGENQGELNVYGDHHTADDKTCRVPLIIRGPDVEPGVDDGLHYQVDLAPSITELVDGDVPAGWDGQSFADSITGNTETGRDFLVVSQGAWSCQRGVRWDDWLLIRTYHDGLKDFASVELYDLVSDPHETTNLAREQPNIAYKGLTLLDQWVTSRLLEAATDQAGGNPDAPRALTDPMLEVIREGGPHHAKVEEHVESYAERLRATGREDHAARLEAHRGYVSQSIESYLE
jgi:choline-sulfatase